MLSLNKKRKIDAIFSNIINLTKEIQSVKRIILAYHTGTGEKTRIELEQISKLIKSLNDEETKNVLFNRDKISDPEEKQYLQMRYDDLISQYGIWGKMYKIISALGKKGITLEQMKDNIDDWLMAGLTYDYGDTPLETMLATKPTNLPLQQRVKPNTEERDIAFRKHQKELENIARIKREKGIKEGKRIKLSNRTRKADIQIAIDQMQTYLENVTDTIRNYGDLFKTWETKRNAALESPDTAEVFNPQTIRYFREDMYPGMEWDSMPVERKMFFINKKYHEDYENLTENLQKELDKQTEILKELITS